ncbi:MAG: DUF1343 domain-containing protein [Flavobacteriaceae bacterium]|nr:DUF1343 domain-containing protein [Flavobacteriaceae bacterium]
MLKRSLFFIFSIITINTSCGNEKIIDNNKTTNKIIVGAERINEYKSLITAKKIGIVANHTSVIFKSSNKSKSKLLANEYIDYTHIVDSLLKLNIEIKKIFTPEHGYKGEKPNGANISDDVDKKTGLEIISLHGKKRKYGELSNKDLEEIEIMIFDIQDVGVRFYTHISTLHYVMKACAQNNIPLLVLDRPNPNIHYVDGPVLESENKSFVGMHNVPIVYGMTIGEYANMINGENWLGNDLNCELKIIKIKNYDRKSNYSLPIKPSPNLPNDKSINLYPSLCLFEGTNVSVGRGTNEQFTIYGSPFLDAKIYKYRFKPKPNSGSSSPKNNGLVCFGEQLKSIKDLNRIELKYLINSYNNSSNKDDFFNSFFVKLSGTKKLKEQIINNWSENEIRSSWKYELNDFKKIRKKYLLY